MINEVHPEKVVTTCPECYRTIKQDYAEISTFDFDVLHISEFLSESIDEGKLKFDELARKVTYQDPCRLGRHMKVYDPPRKVITSIPGIEMLEMNNIKENAICCGVGSWMTCSRYSKSIQVNRLEEALGSGADSLITTCPKCQIHLKCTMNERVPLGTEKITIDISDLSTVVAEALNLI
jgi:Fe-S oxidoreductase